MADTKDDSMISNSEFDQSLREVEGMSDEELYESLKATGKEIGPIVETTRKLYQKQLAGIMASPNGNVRKSIVTNGNTEDQNGNASDSDDASFETSSRASHSSRASSNVARKSRASSNPVKPISTGDSPTTRKSEEKGVIESPITGIRYSGFETPTRTSRTFDEYVAESEARKAASANTYLRRQNSVERTVEDTKERSGSQTVKLALLIAVFVAIVAYVYLKYGSALMGAPKDREAIIDEEIEKLTKETT